MCRGYVHLGAETVMSGEYITFDMRLSWPILRYKYNIHVRD